MGHKIHPKSVRLGYIQDWQSKWFAPREMPALLGDHHVARQIEIAADRQPDARGGRLSAVPRGSRRAVAREGRDDPVRIHAPDAVVAGVVDVDVALRVAAHAVRTPQAGLRGGPAVTGESRGAVSGDIIQRGISLAFVPCAPWLI